LIISKCKVFYAVACYVRPLGLASLALPLPLSGEEGNGAMSGETGDWNEGRLSVVGGEPMMAGIGASEDSGQSQLAIRLGRKKKDFDTLAMRLIKLLPAVALVQSVLSTRLSYTEEICITIFASTQPKKSCLNNSV
jgi:hypothetical protein